MLFSFTSKLGSLLHPITFGFIVPLWVVTAVLGWKARQARKHPVLSGTSIAGGEDAPLLLDGVSSARQLQQLRSERLHHKLSATLLFLTMFTMLVGMYNTFCRSGRLFPGPHLYGGLLFALAVSFNAGLVPFLGDKEGVRIAHGVMGVVALCLLANQVKSGIPILRSVWKTVPW